MHSRAFPVVQCIKAHKHFPTELFSTGNEVDQPNEFTHCLNKVDAFQPG